MNYIKLIIYILTLLITGTSLSQDKIIIISQKVGEEINLPERNKYQLLVNIKDFISAVFYYGADGKYFVNVVFGKDAKDSNIYLSKEQLFKAAIRVEYQEEISKGNYPNDIKIYLDTSYTDYIVKFVKLPSNILPFAGKNLNTDNYPTIGIGLSLSYLSMDFSPIEAFFKHAETSLNQPEDKMDFNPSSILSISLYLHIYKMLGIELETGLALKSDVDFYYTGAFLQFHLPMRKPGWLKPFIESGIVKHSFHVEKLYQLDPNLNSYVKVISHGDHLGYIAKAGFDIGDPDYGGINVFGSYSYIPEISNDTYGYHTSLMLGGFQIGTGLRIYF